MKNEMRSLGFLMLCLAGGFPAFPQTPPDPPAPAGASLKEAAQALMLSGADQNSLDVLRAYSRLSLSDPYLRSRTMSAYALAVLSKGDTNLFERARLTHLATFPNDQRLIPVKLADCVLACKTCRGAGYLGEVRVCNACKETGSCAKCRGTGKWIGVDTKGPGPRNDKSRKMATPIDCPDCKGTAICPKCNGQSIKRTVCSSCDGKGAALDLPMSKISSAFTAVLGEIVAAVNSEEVQMKRIADAKAEPDLARRMAAFQVLLSELKTHPERPEIERLLAADQQAWREKTEQETAERTALGEELRILRSLKSAPDPASAVLMLREFLGKNPDSPNRLEAQIILDELLAKIEKQRKKERLLYIIGGALFVLGVLSCLHISFFKYTLYSHNRTVPRGVLPPNAVDFADPLSLNAKDSRNRVKRRTGRIPLSQIPKN